MNQTVLNSMSEAEQQLVAETSKQALIDLDEEELLALHARIRETRAKYVTIYRRNARGHVVKRGGRGFSYPKNQRDRAKAEVFETALAAVSKAVAKQASEAAAELKASRLEAAKPTGSGPAMTTAKADMAEPTKARRATAKKTTGGVKKDAASSAAGRKRQAKRDAR